MKNYNIQHSIYFKEWMHKLNSKGFNITIDYNIVNASINSNSIKEKMYGVVLLKNETRNRYNGSVYDVTKLIINDRLNDAFKEMSKRKKENYTLYYIKSNALDLNKFPIKRKEVNINNYVSYILDNRLGDEIIKNGKIIFKEIYKGE